MKRRAGALSRRIRVFQGSALYYAGRSDGNSDASPERILSHYDGQIASRERILRL